jgi:putative Mn2+ efflux pump MntP
MLVLLIFGLACVSIAAMMLPGALGRSEVDSRVWAWIWVVLLGGVGTWMLWEVITWTPPNEGAIL